MGWRIYGEKLYYLRNNVFNMSIEETVESVNAGIEKQSLHLLEKTLKRWENLTTKRYSAKSRLAFKELAAVFKVPVTELIHEPNGSLDPKVQKYYSGEFGNGKKVKSKSSPAPNPKCKIKLAIFDFDGTLFTNYTFSWQLVWKYLNFSDNERRKLYRDYRAGVLTYPKWCQACVDKFRERGLSLNDFDAIVKTAKPVKNLFEGLEVLKSSGVKLAIVSGGISQFIQALIPNHLDYFDDIYANELLFDEDTIVEGCIPTEYDFVGKKAAAIQLCNKHNLQPEQASFTGDQINDESLWDTNLRTIAFNAQEGSTRDSFDHVVDTGDFFDVVKVILRDK